MSDDIIQSLNVIEDGSTATAKALRENFTYLDNRITNTLTNISGKEVVSSKGTANGYCPLDSNAKVPSTYLSNTLDNITPHLVPVGAIIMWGTAPIPDHWVAMIGQEDLSLYPALQALGYESLPDTRSKAPWGSNQEGAFETIEAGLPDITGSVANAAYGYYNNHYNNKGAFSDSTKSTSTGYNQLQGGSDHDGTYRMNTLTFKASKSNNIYGKSSTVQPPAWTTVFIIKYE